MPETASETALEVVLRRDRWIVIACLVAVTAIAWAYLFVMAKAMAAMEGPSPWHMFMGLMPMGRWGLREYTLGFVMWSLMMIGMMLPSAAPMLVVHARLARRAQAQGRPVTATSLFAAGYLLVWTGFSLLAAILQGALVEVGLVADMMASTSASLAGMLLIAAGLYQWTPLKNACLAHCRSPIHFLSQRWRPGSFGALRMGVEHGAYCVGCCWLLMGVLFAVGIMNLAWIAAIAAFVLLEKVAPFGVWTSRIAGVLLVTLGIATIARGIGA